MYDGGKYIEWLRVAISTVYVKDHLEAVMIIDKLLVDDHNMLYEPIA